MAGAAKQRANQERDEHARRQAGSYSDGTSSSGKASQSVKSAVSATGSRVSRVSGRGGYDGNRDPDAPGPAATRNPNTSRPQVSESMSKNIDLGQAAWARVAGRDLPSGMPARPAPSTLGQGCKITLNTFDVTEMPSKKVYQYEVLIDSGAEKRGVIKKVWESQAVRSSLGQSFLFDGNRLAWSLKPIERELRISVDLDAEQGRKPRAKGPDIHRVIIRQTNEVGFTALKSYLAGKSDFDTSCLEAINVLDHLVRETPGQKYTSIKRSFFARGEQRYNLSPGIEAFKGVYASPRVAHAPGNQARLSVNLDVMNTVFWTESPLTLAATNIANCRDVNGLIAALKQGGKNSRAGQELKKMHKLHVLANHRNSKTGGKPDAYVIKEFVYTSARDAKFEKDGRTISVYEYFAKEFNIRLSYPDLPLVKMTSGKNTLLPMEVLKLKENQRYSYKLDERQTSAMIKFAATPPADRWASIQHGLKMLDWPNDPVLKAFGFKIDTAPKTVDGRLIPAPVVKFGQGEAKPGTSGRWDLKGKKFLAPNSQDLKSWSVTVVPGRRGGKPDKAVVEKFIQDFVKIYTMHGGKVVNKNPAFLLAQGGDVGSWVTSAWNAAGNQSQARPSILCFILPDKDSTTYGRIKRSGECRYGVVTQCMQYAHVQKCQAQYISNVCMKFNAKLGGITCRAVGSKTSGPTGVFAVPTLIIGADVSHAAPGAQTPSMAAMTFSMDKLATRYAAACETNGFRVEMILKENIESIVKPMLQYWVKTVGGGSFPKQIIYFRDGVSEGQYAHVLDQEVHDMKNLLKTADPKLDIPFIVVVGGKRHHTRFFPQQGKGDRNNNPLPGTLVETGVTHPRENDFYLNSHAAIKGTARPMHYHVLLNEPKMANEQLQTLIYEHCYQYIRATTPISQHPAIYYAHLASNRAIPHDPKWGGSSDGLQTQASRPRSGSQSGSQGGRSPSRTGGSSSGVPTEFEKLLPMPNQGGIQTSMWYI